MQNTINHMTHAEAAAEIRRHMIAIIRVCILYFGLNWRDFIPREENSIMQALADNQTPTLPIAPIMKR